MNKKTTFLNSSWASCYDLFIFQETNVAVKHDIKKYTNFKLIKKLGLNLTDCNHENYCSGTMIVWNPTRVEIKKHKASNLTKNFDIGVFKCETGLETFTIITAYRSPSMKERHGNIEDFMDTLIDIIHQCEGRVLIVGDLNFEKGRKVAYKDGEENFIKMIEDCNMKSLVNENTHFKNDPNDPNKKIGNQLDYAFSNFKEIEASVGEGFISDHASIRFQLKLQAEIITVPEKTVTKMTVCQESVQNFVDNCVNKMQKMDNLSTCEAVVELDMLLYDIEVIFAKKRKFKQHRRVRNCSRQVSNSILNDKFTAKQKRIDLKKNMEKDAARQLVKNCSSKSFGKVLMAPVGLAAKREEILGCSINPEVFRKEILEDEAETDHKTHPNLDPKWSGLLRPLQGEVLDDALKKCRSKWGRLKGFSDKFWRSIIAPKLNTKLDYGVYSFAKVETVIKDESKLDTTKGYRLVWKADSRVEKLYDFMKSATLDAAKLKNDAYCLKRSTQRSLAQVASWHINKNEGLIGIDFQNAFGIVCRPCINNLLGVEFLNPNINFVVRTNNKRSVLSTSIIGSGAGRATGGGGFNTLMNHHIHTDEHLVKFIKCIVPFADDSLIKTLLEIDSIRWIIQGFMNAVGLGMKMHKHGKKGPTLLVHKGKVDQVSKKFNGVDFNGCDLNITETVKFLGVNCLLIENRMIAEVLPNNIKIMNYMVSQVSKSSHLSQYTSDLEALNRVFRASLAAVAALVESRIQYSVLFVNERHLVKLFEIHRRAVCAIAGKAYRFFGFRTLQSNTTEKPVTNLYEKIDGLESPTYKKLCQILGRPTFKQITLRAAQVIIDQTNIEEVSENYRSQRYTNLKFKLNEKPVFIVQVLNFVEKCKNEKFDNSPPKENDFCRKFYSLFPYQKRRNFIKAATSNLLLDNLQSKGWRRENMECRIQGCKHPTEDLHHIVSSHMKFNELTTNAKFTFKKAVEEERVNKRKNKRPFFNFAPDEAEILATIFDGIREPHLKACKTENPRKVSTTKTKQKIANLTPKPSSVIELAGANDTFKFRKSVDETTAKRKRQNLLSKPIPNEVNENTFKLDGCQKPKPKRGKLANPKKRKYKLKDNELNLVGGRRKRGRPKKEMSVDQNKITDFFKQPPSKLPRTELIINNVNHHSSENNSAAVKGAAQVMGLSPEVDHY